MIEISILTLCVFCQSVLSQHFIISHSVMKKCGAIDHQKSRLDGISLQQLVERDSPKQIVLRIANGQPNQCLLLFERCQFKSCDELFKEADSIEMFQNNTASDDTENAGLSQENKFLLVLLTLFFAIMSLFIVLRCMSCQRTHPDYTLLSPSP